MIKITLINNGPIDSFALWFWLWLSFLRNSLEFYGCLVFGKLQSRPSETHPIIPIILFHHLEFLAKIWPCGIILGALVSTAKPRQISAIASQQKTSSTTVELTLRLYYRLKRHQSKRLFIFPTSAAPTAVVSSPTPLRQLSSSYLPPTPTSYRTCSRQHFPTLLEIANP